MKKVEFLSFALVLVFAISVIALRYPESGNNFKGRDVITCTIKGNTLIIPLKKLPNQVSEQDILINLQYTFPGSEAYILKNNKKVYAIMHLPENEIDVQKNLIKTEKQ